MLVELTDPAAEDVIHASVTYELERPGLGFLFDEEVNAAIERIAQRPLQYPEISLAVRRALLRVFPYSVYFTIVDERVRVFAVLHQHRQPESWKGR
jgi:plasmid stabilization system protein ParE